MSIFRVPERSRKIKKGNFLKQKIKIDQYTYILAYFGVQYSSTVSYFYCKVKWKLVTGTVKLMVQWNEPDDNWVGVVHNYGTLL